MSNIKLITKTAAIAALTCVATLISIPAPPTGYINLGDAMVLLCGCLLGPVPGAVAAAIGSGLADAILGYMYYIPATVLIKGAMALVMGIVFTKANKRLGIKAFGGMFLSETIMVGGYYLFYALFLGNFLSALSTLIGNFVQGFVGIACGWLLIKATHKIK